MGKVARALSVLLCLSFSLAVRAQETAKQVTPTPAVISPAIMPLDQIREGMKGTALTVFQGVKPEPMDVEVLGVLRNVNGPKGNIILVRLHGTKPEYTGVVAGMSGSPVYFDGKLAGALAFRIGEFSKEPIAGVTPIEEMLEISALDRRPGARRNIPASDSPSVNPPADHAQNQGGSTQAASPGDPASLPAESYSSYLKAIETPLVFNGFSQETLQRYGSQFAAAGIVPVMGIGSASDRKQPEPIEPGSAVSAVLVRGDMDIAATCTVTYVDPERLLACGHPLLQFGEVDLPMTKATVLATLPSPLNAFKIVNTTETVGAFVQDRQNGIMGVPADYKPAAQPINPWPAKPDRADPMYSYYGGNTVWVPLKDGTIQRTSLGGYLDPMQNQFMLGPMIWNMSASAFKTVKLTERVLLRFNADFLNNVFNMPGTNLPGSDGIATNRTSANSPRVLQLTLRLSW